MQTLDSVEALLTAIDEHILAATVTMKVTIHNDITLLEKPAKMQNQSLSLLAEQAHHGCSSPPL